MKTARLAALVWAGIGALPGAARAQVCLEFDPFGDLMQDGQNECGPYVDPANPGPLDAYDIQVAVPAESVDQMRVYYSLEEGPPQGAYGEPSNAQTHVVQGALTCSYMTEGGKRDVFRATIPAMNEVAVRYKLSVWKEGPERAEWFADSECSCLGSACAATFDYSVGQGEPRPMPDEYLIAADTPRTIPGPGLLKNDHSLDRFETDFNELRENLLGEIEFRGDNSFVYAPPTGFIGVDRFQYYFSAYGGEYRSNPATVRFVVKMPPALVSITRVRADPGGCAAGGERIDSGLDNGAGGGEPLDGTLQEGEITRTSFVCDGAAGADGAAGPTARVKVGAEPEGANCAKGGQKIESGLDVNGDLSLDSTEVTATSYVCNGAQGKSGCSASPGALSLVGALGTLAWAGVARRRIRS